MAIKQEVIDDLLSDYKTPEDLLGEAVFQDVLMSLRESEDSWLAVRHKQSPERLKDTIIGEFWPPRRQ